MKFRDYINENSSQSEIDKWSRIIDKQGKKGIERLRFYMGSLALGRDFQESMESFLKRKGLAEFDKWAKEKLK